MITNEQAFPKRSHFEDALRRADSESRDYIWQEFASLDEAFAWLKNNIDPEVVRRLAKKV